VRRLSQLINDVRFQANEDSNRFSDARFIKIFNDAQDEIARTINVRASENSQFQDNYTTDILPNVSTYELPSDVYAESYVTAVFKKARQGVAQFQSYQPLRRITVKEVGSSYGYFIQNKSIVLSLVPSSGVSNGLMVTYTKRLPKLGNRFGRISSITGNQISIRDFDDKIIPTSFSDFICTVDRNGNQIDKGIEISNYVPSRITTATPITATVGDYVVIGEDSTTNSQLPVECEKYLTIFAERMVHYINSSRQDMATADMFSEKEKSDIADLFSDNESDTKYPPIVDDTYLN